MSGRKPVFRFGASGSAKNTKDPQVNFVFNLPGGGAQTPGGFNFAPPAAPTSTPLFNFGASANTTTPAFGNPTSAFGAAPAVPQPTTPTNQLTFTFGAQPAKPSPLGFGANAASNTSVFGAASQPSPFGAQPTTPTAGAFGQPPAAQNTGFSFGNANAPASSASPFDRPAGITAPKATGPTSQFSFGSTQAPASAFGTASSSPALQSPLRRTVSDVSGLNQNSLLNKPAFGTGTGFGTMPAATPPSSIAPPAVTSSSSFAFGNGTSATTPTATTTTGGFSFGAGTTTSSTTPKTEASKPSGGFSFGAPSTPTATSATASKPFFSFSKPAESEQKTSLPGTPLSEPKKDGSSAFSFLKSEPATAATSTSAITTITSAAPTTPLFSFGGSSPSKPAQTPSILTSKPADGASATPSFSFGSSTAATTPSTSAPAATSAAPKFSFGVASDKKAGATSAASGAATIAAPAIPSLQVPAQPAQPSEFSFDKILEQMKATSISMPQEIQFSLANAGMPGRITGQTALILQSTNFPIEKIEPMTRHSELPDEARNQLDELEKYMKSEMQTCNFLKKNKMSSKAEEIEKIKKDTESMVKQMEGLHSRLKGHSELIEQLWNGVDYQHRNAVQASEIVDNYKKRDHQNRWSFGYGVHNNYFALLARNFEIRLERYRQNIVDIEATISSMSRHKNISPKDVTDTIRLQYDSLLRATGRVVEVHEDLEIHKRRYKQYCELFYGQVVNPLSEKSHRQMLDFQEHLKPLPSTS
ncbi:unnamed protein product [Umbelopsis vinacea]